MFDRRLSLEIDAVYDELDRLDTDNSLWAWLRSIYLLWKLHRLERRIP